MKFRLFCILFLSIFLSVFLAACAMTSGQSKGFTPFTPQVWENLETRAEQRWRSLIERDFARAYEFETPAYRGAYSLDMFTRQLSNTIDWRDIELLDRKQMSDAVAEVRLRLTYAFIDGDESQYEHSIPSVVTERWLLKEGEWWFVPSVKQR